MEPIALIPSRAWVLPRCPLPSILHYVCYAFCVFTIGEGVYFSSFLCVYSMCLSSPLTGLVGLVGPVGIDYPSSAWCSRRVLPPLSFVDDTMCYLWMSVSNVCRSVAFLVGVLSPSSLWVAGSLRGMASVGLLGYGRLLGLYLRALLARVCFALPP